MQQAFYVLRGNSVADITLEQQWLTTIQDNIKSINLIISQAFQVDNHGTVWGGVNQPVFKLAQKNHIPVMGMLTNENFDPNEVQQLLTDKEAEKRAINNILSLCQTEHLYGIQVDFENMSIQDRDLYTQFYTRLSQVLHQHGFKVSVTLFPETTNTPSTTVLKREYDNLEGVYDFSALGKASDFVTVMAYNQSTIGTTPGPVAGTPWIKKVVQYTLQYIPADKISLGIPSYSNYWAMTDHNGSNEVVGSNLSYAAVLALLKTNQQTLKWDADQQVPYTFYFNDQFGEYIFAENAQSFNAKLAIIKQYHLLGFTVWRLGLEDPAIWKLL